MNDDQHLWAWYFGTIVLVAALALGGYLYLRNSFIGFGRVLFPQWASGGLRRFLLTLIFFFAFTGVFSVSFYDCNHGNYEQISKDRPYVEERARTQAAEGLHWMALGCLFLGLVLGVAKRRPDVAPPEA